MEYPNTIICVVSVQVYIEEYNVKQNKEIYT